MAGLPNLTHFKWNAHMLTPYVMGLVFANCVTATCLAAVLGALRIAGGQKIIGETLTHREPTPTGLSGWAGGAGRPFDIADLSKEEIHELPTAA
jgi:hypothetical protein